MKEPTRILEKLFDLFDENDVALVLRHIARRMVILKKDMPDAGFMYNTLIRFAKTMESDGLSEEEMSWILNPPPDENGRLKAIRKYRERTGMRIQAAAKVVDEWMAKNKVVVTEMTN